MILSSTAFPFGGTCSSLCTSALRRVHTFVFQLVARLALLAAEEIAG